MDSLLFEIVGAAVGIAYLVTEYRANAWVWIFGLLMPLFYIFIFFNNHLYANAAINLYYVGASLYGLWCWRMKCKSAQDGGIVCAMPRRLALPLAAIVVALTLVLRWLLLRLGESNTAFLDAFTAALNMVGMWMLAKGYYQQWICWIVIEPLMVGMSLYSHMYPTAVLYLVYCVVAVLGYREWKRTAEGKK